MSNTTARPERATFLDLEDGLQTSFQFAAILADMLDAALELGRGESVGDGGAFRFLISREELEQISFISNQSQAAARKVRDEFYATIKRTRTEQEPAPEAAPPTIGSPELLEMLAPMIDALNGKQLAKISAKVDKLTRRAKVREAGR